MWLKTSRILPVLSAHEGPSPSNIISVFTLKCPVSSMKIVFKLHFSPLIPARPTPTPTPRPRTASFRARTRKEIENPREPWTVQI